MLGYQPVLMGQDQEVAVHGSNSSLGSDFLSHPVLSSNVRVVD